MKEASLVIGKNSEKAAGRGSWRDSHGVRYISVAYHPCIQKLRIRKKKNINDIARERLNSLRHRAARKGISMTLSIEDIVGIIELPCAYCGFSDTLSEIDRKNSTLGYTQINTAPACRRCNTIKNNVVTYDEMMFIADFLGWRV